MRRIFHFACALMLIPSVYAADTPVPGNRVSFDVTAEQSVDSDLLVVRLFAQHEARQQAQAANRVNEDMAWALALAATQSSVKAQTLDYRTNPVYEERHIRAWQTRQTLRLESADRDALTKLLGSVQERLAIETLGYEVSAGKRNATEQRLTEDVIKRFSARAGQIAKAFARDGYTLVSINISNGAGVRPPIAYRGGAQALQAQVADPSIEAGQQILRVHINGTIELSAN